MAKKELQKCQVPINAGTKYLRKLFWMWGGFSLTYALQDSLKKGYILEVGFSIIQALHNSYIQLIFFGEEIPQLKANWWLGARWLGYLESPYERD